MPQAGEVKSLFRAFLREGRKFPNYNIREYVKRRAREGFQQGAGVADASLAEQLWQQAKGELEVVKRQALVYQLYARKQRSIMDIPPLPRPVITSIP